MIAQPCPYQGLILLAAIACTLTSGAAWAQIADQPVATAPPFSAMKARVPAGDVIDVTDTTGVTVKGTLAAVTDDTVKLYIRGTVRSVAAADVTRIQWYQRDSLLNGVAIGAGIAAIPGIYWLIADPNECTGMCPEEYAFIGVGAVVGGLVDRAIKRKVTVYSTGALRRRAAHVVIGPSLTRGRKGVLLAVRF